MGAPALLKLTVWPRAGPRPLWTSLWEANFPERDHCWTQLGTRGSVMDQQRFVYKGHLTKQEDSELGSSHNGQGQRVHGVRAFGGQGGGGPSSGQGTP